VCVVCVWMVHCRYCGRFDRCLRSNDDLCDNRVSFRDEARNRCSHPNLSEKPSASVKSRIETIVATDR
jgi:hypothetical protein